MAGVAPFQGPSVFFRIPLEIRQQIYGYCIPQNVRLYLRDDAHNLKHTCRKDKASNTTKQDGLPDSSHLASQSSSHKFGRSRPRPHFCLAAEDTNMWALERTGTFSRLQPCIHRPHGSGSNHKIHCVHLKPEPRGWVESEMMLNFLARKGQGQEVTREAASVHTLIGRPGEPTIHITDYCMRCNNYYMDVPTSRRSALPGLLLICRQINNEVETMLYANNTFIVDIPHDQPYESTRTPYNRNTGTVDIRHVNHPKQRGAIERLGPQRRAKIRKLILNVRPEWAYCRLDIGLERNIWDSVLGNLKVVALVIDKPGLPPIYVVGDEKDNYTESKVLLTSMFEYFRDVVPETADIVVSGLGMEARPSTVRLAERVMPGRCKFLNVCKPGPFGWQYNDPLWRVTRGNAHLDYPRDDFRNPIDLSFLSM
ncbi:hypothetical protein GE09DRAFT_1226567 [Coniochaeta sp. 2T2.1]|nr:hypothetical protein GE09DRAFT_1226567 [Coniochaeta sp. 2T2.1]